MKEKNFFQSKSSFSANHWVYKIHLTTQKCSAKREFNYKTITNVNTYYENDTTLEPKF